MNKPTALPLDDMEPRESTPGTINDHTGLWEFTYDVNQDPDRSSYVKAVYRGSYVELSTGYSTPARALAFLPGCIEAFGSECANLYQLAALGVGPKALVVTQFTFETNTGSQLTIIEEDVGDNLSHLIDKTAMPRKGMPILHKAGTEARDLENKKILYDVFVQVQNAHRRGIYHRDLRCENVCVRRYGEQPADIRATVIDFDLGTSLGDGNAAPGTPLHKSLFTIIPSYLAGKESPLVPSAFKLDMGYLAALWYHVEKDRLILNQSVLARYEVDDFVSFLQRSIGFFGYGQNTSTPYLYARELYTTLEIDPLAKSLGLVPANNNTFASQRLLDCAVSFHRPYLDKEEMDAVMRRPEANLEGKIDKIAAAKFETYKALRRAQGLEVLYERIEDQPASLQRSNYAQAEHIPEKVRALGYELIAQTEYDGEAYEVVSSFTSQEIETLARLEHDRWMDERISTGWTLDEQSEASDAVAKTTPYLIPYDRIPNKIQEYDRDAARQVIPLARSAGLLVVRARQIAPST